MASRITQRDIAREAGVSHATVSLALRGHPGIPQCTAEKIRSIAKRLGYMPDPMLAALSVYRKNQKPRTYKATLGWINSSKDPNLFHSSGWCEYYNGATQRAAELGYKVEEIRFVDFGHDTHRICKSLRNRGIIGLFLGIADDWHSELHLDWDQFSAVRLGYSYKWPVLHTIMNAQFRSARTAVDHLVGLGYRRIGFVGTEEFDHRTFGYFSGGYSVGVRMNGVDTDIPLFIDDGLRHEDYRSCIERLRKWIIQYRVDCILADHWQFASILIKTLGISIPQDLGCASLNVASGIFSHSGIYQNGPKIGAAAVDQLIGLIYRREKGIPATPIHTLIEGTWNEGSTTREISKRDHLIS